MRSLHSFIKEKECLTEDQARHVNKMVETDKVINKMTRNRLKRGRQY